MDNCILKWQKNKLAEFEYKILKDFQSNITNYVNERLPLLPSSEQFGQFVIDESQRTKGRYWGFVEDNQMQNASEKRFTDFDVQIMGLISQAYNEFSTFTSLANRSEQTATRPVEQISKEANNEYRFLEGEEVLYMTYARDPLCAQVVKIQSKESPWCVKIHIFSINKKHLTHAGRLIKLRNEVALKAKKNDKRKYYHQNTEVLYREDSGEFSLAKVVMERSQNFNFTILIFKNGTKRQTVATHLLELSVYVSQMKGFYGEQGSPVCGSCESKSETCTDNLENDSDTEQNKWQERFDDDSSSITSYDDSSSDISSRDRDIVIETDRKPLPFAMGEKVLYKDSSGNQFEATIVHIHLQDGIPFFSVIIHGTGCKKNADPSSLMKYFPDSVGGFQFFIPSHKANAPSSNEHEQTTEDFNFVKGEQVMYKDSMGEILNATISEVHYEDGTPFYTVCIHATGREKNTIASKLLKVAHGQESKPPKRPFNAVNEQCPQEAHQPKKMNEFIHNLRMAFSRT